MEMFNKLVVLESISGKRRYIKIVQQKDGCFSLNDTKDIFINGLSYSHALISLQTQVFKAEKQGFKEIETDKYPLTKVQIKKHNNYFKNNVNNLQLDMF